MLWGGGVWRRCAGSQRPVPLKSRVTEGEPLPSAEGTTSKVAILPGINTTTATTTVRGVTGDPSAGRILVERTAAGTFT